MQRFSWLMGKMADLWNDQTAFGYHPQNLDQRLDSSGIWPAGRICDATNDLCSLIGFRLATVAGGCWPNNPGGCQRTRAELTPLRLVVLAQGGDLGMYGSVRLWLLATCCCITSCCSGGGPRNTDRMFRLSPVVAAG